VTVDDVVCQREILVRLISSSAPGILTSWRVPLLSGPFVEPEYGINILSSSKERPEQLYLLVCGGIGIDLGKVDRRNESSCLPEYRSGLSTIVASIGVCVGSA